MPGMALLCGLGFVTRARQLPVALGPAYFCGVAALMPVLILLLVVGLPVRMPTVLITAAMLAAGVGAFTFVAARRGRLPQHPETQPASSAVERWIGRVGAVLLGLYFVFGAGAFTKLATLGDDWQMWSYKALGLFYYGDLQPELFAGKDPGPTHFDYPILKPLFDSIFYRAMDGPDLQRMHLFLWILFASFVWTLAYLLVRRGFPLVPVLPPIAILAIGVAVADITRIGYVDIMVATFVATGALCLAQWLDDGGFAWAVLGAVMLAAAANTKNEGLVAAALVLIACAAYLRLTAAGRARQWLAATAIALAGALPWIVWRGAHDLGNTDVSVSDAVNPGHLVANTDRLRPAMAQSFEQLADQSRWGWLVPCFIAVAVVSIVTGERRRLSGFYLGLAGLMLVSVWWAYWAGSLPILDWLFFSVPRLVASVVFVCAVGLMHLAGLMAEARPRAHGVLRHDRGSV